MNVLAWVRTQWDRVSAWVLIAFGGIAIIVGWNGVSREALTPQQVPYIISGGIGGLFLLGVGAMLWLSADLRDEWRKLDSIERNTRPASEPNPPADDPFSARSQLEVPEPPTTVTTAPYDPPPAEQNGGKQLTGTRPRRSR